MERSQHIVESAITIRAQMNSLHRKAGDATVACSDPYALLWEGTFHLQASCVSPKKLKGATKVIAVELAMYNCHFRFRRLQQKILGE